MAKFETEISDEFYYKGSCVGVFYGVRCNLADLLSLSLPPALSHSTLGLKIKLGAFRPLSLSCKRLRDSRRFVHVYIRTLESEMRFSLVIVAS